MPYRFHSDFIAIILNAITWLNIYILIVTRLSIINIKVKSSQMHNSLCLDLVKNNMLVSNMCVPQC